MSQSSEPLPQVGGRTVVVAVDGYFRSNFGDDVMLQGLSSLDDRLVLEILDATTLPPLSGAFTVCPPVSSKGWVAEWRRLRRCDAYLLIGGSMFIDQRGDGFRSSARKYLRSVRRAWRWAAVRSAGGRFLVVGANLGPLETRAGRWVTVFLLSRAERIVVRDQASQDFLARNGIASDLAPDLALPLFKDLPNATSRNFKSVDVGLSVMRLPEMTLADSALFYAGLLAWLRDNGSVRTVRLLASHRQAPSDVDVIDAIGDVPGLSIERHVYDSDPELFRIALQSCEYVVGFRLHVSLCALVQGQVVAVVSYSSKVDRAVSMILPAVPVIRLAGRQWEDVYGDVLRRLQAAEPAHISSSTLSRARLHLDAILAGESM